MNFDHLEFPLDDETAEKTIDTGRHPLYRGKWGLVVIRLRVSTGQPLSFWHEAGYEENFSEDHAEYPLLFQTLKGAKARQLKMVQEGPPFDVLGHDHGAVVLATWMSPDWDVSFPKHTKYSDIRGQFPGSPTQ